MVKPDLMSFSVVTNGARSWVATLTVRGGGVALATRPGRAPMAASSSATIITARNRLDTLSYLSGPGTVRRTHQE